MDALFQIVTMIIPKAGVQLGGIPLTLNLVLFALVLLRNPNQTILSIQRHRGIATCYAVLLLFGLITFLLGILDGFPTFTLAQIITVVASPLAGVIALRMNPQVSFKILISALIIVNLYAAIQFAVGIEQTAIPGLTYTSGQDLASKPIGYGMSSTASALKMPSTFQNGNYLGLFDALGVPLAVIWQPARTYWKALRYFAIACGVLGVILCGSRSTVIPFALVILLLLAQRYRATASRMKSTYLAASGIAIVGLSVYMLVFQQPVIQQFVTRNIMQTLNDPTAAGRTTQWLAMAAGIANLNGTQLLRLTFFGQGAYGLGGEGLPTFFTTFGFFSTVAFYGMLIAAMVYLWKDVRTRAVTLGVFCTFFTFCIDSSFYYPPNVMLVFIMIGMAFSTTPSQERYPVLYSVQHGVSHPSRVLNAARGIQ